MKFPKQIRTFCPFCNSHQMHKVKIASKGSARTLAKGNRSHHRSLLGHGSKRAGEKTVKKQGKRQKLMLTCEKCKKKHEKVLGGGRTKKKVEVRS